MPYETVVSQLPVSPPDPLWKSNAQALVAAPPASPAARPKAISLREPEYAVLMSSPSSLVE
jgi:hypothetical protein